MKRWFKLKFKEWKFHYKKECPWCNFKLKNIKYNPYKAIDIKFDTLECTHCNILCLDYHGKWQWHFPNDYLQFYSFKEFNKKMILRVFR